jgi:hypothetical protein
VCLSIEALENELCLNPSGNSMSILGAVMNICFDNDLQSALKSYHMNKLGIKYAIYIYLMKRKYVKGIYYFRKILDVYRVVLG